jgi:hypothetical protein
MTAGTATLHTALTERHEMPSNIHLLQQQYQVYCQIDRIYAVEHNTCLYLFILSPLHVLHVSAWTYAFLRHVNTNILQRKI